MFQSERQKREAEQGALNTLLDAKGYSSQDLENMKRLLLTPCSYCAGTGQDPHAKYADCSTCKGYGVLVPNLDPRKFLITIANLNGAYSDLKKEKEQLITYLDIFLDEFSEKSDE